MFSYIKIKIRAGINKILFYFNLPKSIKSIDWKEKTVLRIGGIINTILEKKIINAKKLLDVNISDNYITLKNKVDIKADAHELPMIDSGSVDFVGSSHTIEHLTNPIKALKEWNRILRDGGIIYACIPYYKKTFDHNRKVTELEHLISDYKNNVGLNDETHIQEFIKNHDIEMDVCFKDRESWYKNYITNPLIYTHYHVFDLELVENMMNYCGFKTINIFYNGISIEYFGKK